MVDIDMSRRNKKPRLLLESEREKLEEFIDLIHYSPRYALRAGLGWPIEKGKWETNTNYRYSDNEYEYRHVQLPKNMLNEIPTDYFVGEKGPLKLLWEEEWRGLGITQVKIFPCDRLPLRSCMCRV